MLSSWTVAVCLSLLSSRGQGQGTTDVPTTPPMMTVAVSGDGIPAAGQSYTLTCSVSGASVTTYQWRKDGTVLSETRPILSFSPLRLSDAGQYTCEVTVNSITLTDDENVVIMSKISILMHCLYYTHSLCCAF